MPSSAIDLNRAREQAVDGSGYFYPLTIRQIKPDTRDAVIVAFNVPFDLAEKFRFIQGQYLTLRARIGTEDIRRSYSICSAVQDRQLRIGVKRTPGGVFSTWIIDHLKAGDVIEVMPPEGRFFVPLSPSNARHYVAFAVGSGITPVFSIIKTTLLSEPASRFTLFYGNRASHTVMLREELAELKDTFLDRFSLLHVMTREHQDINLLNGRITAEKSALLLKCFCQPEHVHTIFLCGPQDMVNNVVPALEALGFLESQIKVELFTAKESERQLQRRIGIAPDETLHRATVIVDGRKHSFDMPEAFESILDAGLRNGIDLRHSCKSGVCGTCRAKLVEGQVEMDATYALEDYEIARGFILTCQSHPVTDHVTVDFDEEN